MESVEILCDRNLSLYVLIPWVLYNLVTIIYLLINPWRYRSYTPIYTMVGVNIIFIIIAYAIVPRITNQKAERKAIIKLSPVWEKWVENKEIVDSPIISQNRDGDFLKIQIATGETYFVPYIKQKHKRILIFQYYRCKTPVISGKSLFGCGCS